MKLISHLAATAALVLFPAASLLAGQTSEVTTTPPPATDDGWWFNTLTYGWITASEGDMRLGKIPVPVDVSFSDTIDGVDELEMAFMGGLEVGRGRWSLGVDVTYAKVSDDFPGDGATFDSFTLEQTQWMINPFVACQIIKEERWQLGAFAGARINIFETDLTARYVAGGQLSPGISETWVDPIVGLRANWKFNDQFAVGFRGDIGGFGIASDLTWEAFAGFGWHLSPRYTMTFGYRALGTDYSGDDFATDTVTHGPIFGLVCKF